jgi:hypothetical protein
MIAGTWGAGKSTGGSRGGCSATGTCGRDAVVVRVMITCHGTYIDLGFPPEVLSF